MRGKQGEENENRGREEELNVVLGRWENKKNKAETKKKQTIKKVKPRIGEKF